MNIKIKEEVFSGKRVYTAEVCEYPLCVGQGDTIEEAYKEAEENFKALQEYYAKKGETLNLIEQEETYSGKFMLRIPKSLHRELANRAKAEGVSLNAFTTSLISQRIGAYDVYNAVAKSVDYIQETTNQQPIKLEFPSFQIRKGVSVYEY